MTSSSHRILTLLCALAGCTGVARASLTTSQAYTDLSLFNTDIGNYNLISFGNATFSNYGDTEGGLEVGGNLTLDGGSVATQPSKFGVTTAPTLYVAGNLVDSSSSSIKLQSGYAALPNLTTKSQYSWNTTTDRLTKTSNGAVILDEVNSPSATANIDPRTLNPAVNFTTLKTTFTSLSTSLASATGTGTIKVVGQNLEFDAPTNSSGVVFFDLNMNLLSGNKYNGVTFSNITINVPTNLDFVVNVENANGKTLFGTGSGINFNAGTGDDRLLWNLEGSGSVDLGEGGGFYGAVLAPQFAVSNAASTTINGQVVAASFSDSCAELHFLGFNPDLPPAPEPSTYGLAGAALLGGLVYLRRRARN